MEFLEKHLHSTKDGDSENQNNHDNLGQASCGTMGSVGNSVSTERGGSNLAPACLGPEMEFPFVSKISIESQRLLLETFKMMKSGELAKVDLQKMTSIQVCCVLNVPVKSKLQHPPPHPPGIHQAFDCFNLPGGGEFDPHA